VSARFHVVLDMMQRQTDLGHCWCDLPLSHGGWIDCLQSEHDRVMRWVDIIQEESREQSAAKAGPVMLGPLTPMVTRYPQ